LPEQKRKARTPVGGLASDPAPSALNQTGPSLRELYSDAGRFRRFVNKATVAANRVCPVGASRD